MKTTGLGMACFIALLALGASNTATGARKEPTVQVEVSKRAASLPGIRYAWVAMPAQLEVEFDKRVQDPQLRGRLQAALDKALQDKGYQRVENVQQANFIVAYRVGVRDLQEATVRETASQDVAESAIECDVLGCSQIVSQGSDGAPTIKVKTVDIVEGGLMVEVLQPGEIRVLWRALFKGSVRAKGAKPVDLDRVAATTLASLPKASTATP